MCGRPSTTIHAACDAPGNPTGFHLGPGQVRDFDRADALTEKLSGAQAAIADRADDARERMLEPLAQSVAEIVIPSKKNRREQRGHDRHLYRARHLIESFFARLEGRYSTITTRCDKTAASFPGTIRLAAAIDWRQ